MITDEQVKIAANSYLSRPIDSYLPDGNLTDMRKALEAYEQSKWVKFDDESTWPVVPDGWLNVEVIVHDAKNITDKVSHDYFRPTCGLHHYSDVTHWQYLPEFKE